MTSDVRNLENPCTLALEKTVYKVLTLQASILSKCRAKSLSPRDRTYILKSVPLPVFCREELNLEALLFEDTYMECRATPSYPECGNNLSTCYPELLTPLFSRLATFLFTIE